MKTLDASSLRHPVELQAKQQTQDATTGEMVTSWAKVATLWAAVEPLSAREFIAAQAGQSQITARIVIRYRANVDATMRIVYRGKIYNIHGVLPDMDSGLEYLTLPVSEGVNDG